MDVRHIRLGGNVQNQGGTRHLAEVTTDFRCGPAALWGRVQSLCDGCGGSFSNFGPSISAPDKDDAVPRGRKAEGGKCEGGPVGTTYRMSEGPMIHFDRPRAGTPAPQRIEFPLWATPFRPSAERLNTNTEPVVHDSCDALPPAPACLAARLLPQSISVPLSDRAAAASAHPDLAGQWPDFTVIGVLGDWKTILPLKRVISQRRFLMSPVAIS